MKTICLFFLSAIIIFGELDQITQNDKSLQTQNLIQNNQRILTQENFWCYNNCSNNGNCTNKGCNCFQYSYFYADWDCSKIATQYDLQTSSDITDVFTVLPQSSYFFWVNLSQVLNELMVIEFKISSPLVQSGDAIMINTFNNNNYFQSDQSRLLEIGQSVNISINCSSASFFNNIITFQLYSFFPENDLNVTLTAFYPYPDENEEIDYKIYVTSAVIGVLLIVIILMYLKMRKERIKFQKVLEEKEKQYKIKDFLTQRDENQNMEQPQQVNMENEQNCTICNIVQTMENALKKHPACINNKQNRHYFHDQCLINYAQKSNTCPQCNQVLETVKG